MKENPRSSKSFSSRDRSSPAADSAASRFARGKGRPSHLLVGRVGRAVGLKGEVEVQVTSDAPERFASGNSVVISESSHSLTVESTRTQGDRTIVKFAEIADRDASEALKGAELVIPLTEARALEDDEYWDHDLIGCLVVDVDGREIGSVSDVLHQPSGSLLSVVGESGEHLVPLVREVIRSVEPGKRITIDPIPGLLDD